MSILDVLNDIKDLAHQPKLKVVQAHKILVGGASDILDILSESTTVGTHWGFAGVAKKNGGSGYIVKAHALLQSTAKTPRLVIFLFTQTPTCVLNDNAVNTALKFEDRHIYVGKIDLPAMEDIGTGVSEAVATPSTVGNLPLAFKCASDSSGLYGVVATRDVVTPTALDELSIRLTVEQF